MRERIVDRAFSPSTALTDRAFSEDAGAAKRAGEALGGDRVGQGFRRHRTATLPQGLSA
jgi:hypothetical protein